MKSSANLRKRIITPQKRKSASPSTAQSIKASLSSKSPLSLPKKTLSHTLPKVETNLTLDKTVTFSTHKNLTGQEVEIIGSKNFTEAAAKESRNLFISKCNECSKICDFSSDIKDIKAKAVKTILLKQISASFSLSQISRFITNDVITSFLNMLDKNLFRLFPVIKNQGPADAHDSLLDAAWPHISLVYECLESSFCNPQVGDFPQRFLYKLVDNSLSPDERERRQVKTVLTRLYNKFPSTRINIRQRCSALFLSKRCSPELLDFYYTVANGLSPPLKAETVNSFVTTILPLHCLDNYPQFAKFLVQVMERYIAKSEALLPIVLNYLNKHWPITNRNKQTLFLKEYEDLVMNFEARMSQQLSVQFFRRVNDCIGNQSPSVATTALGILLNPQLSSLVKNTASSLYFMIIFTISDVLKNTWDDNIRDTAAATLDLLNDLDPNAYKKATEMQKSLKFKKSTGTGISKNSWKKVIDLAKAKYPTCDEFKLEDV